jgi:hypothetical protein
MEARDSVGWTYVDVSEPRSTDKYAHLIKQYRAFDRQPWRNLDDVEFARSRITGALMIYHFDKLTPYLRVELLHDSLSIPGRSRDVQEVTACIAYKCSKNGISVENSEAISIGSQCWEKIQQHFGGVLPPPLMYANR